MFSLIAFIITSCQLLIVATCYMMNATDAFYMFAVYGGPIYLTSTMVKAGFYVITERPLYLMVLSFHILKYFIMLRAHVIDQRNPLRTMAILFEVVYLTAGWHFLP